MNFPKKKKKRRSKSFSLCFKRASNCNLNWLGFVLSIFCCCYQCSCGFVILICFLLLFVSTLALAIHTKMAIPLIPMRYYKSPIFFPCFFMFHLNSYFLANIEHWTLNTHRVTFYVCQGYSGKRACVYSLDIFFLRRFFVLFLAFKWLS